MRLFSQFDLRFRASSRPTYCRRGLLYPTARPASQSARSKHRDAHAHSDWDAPADRAVRADLPQLPPQQNCVRIDSFSRRRRRIRSLLECSSNCRHSSDCRFACRLVAATASARAYALKQQRSPHERYVRTLIKVNFIIIIIIIIIFIRRKTIQKAVIENCGQDKSGKSTYNCPRNRQKY